MQNEQDQQMRTKFGNTPAGMCLSLVQNLLCWWTVGTRHQQLCSFLVQLLLALWLWVTKTENYHCLPPFFLFLSKQPWLLCRQLILFAGVGSAILKSLHTRFHQKVTAIICLNLFHYFFNYNTLSYLGFFKYSGGCNMLRLLPMPF